MFGNSTVPSLFSKIQQYQPTLQELIENTIDHEYVSHGIPFSLAGTQFPVKIMKTEAKKRREFKQWLGTWMHKIRINVSNFVVVSCKPLIWTSTFWEETPLIVGFFQTSRRSAFFGGRWPIGRGTMNLIRTSWTKKSRYAHDIVSYCWWLKSCTSWYVVYPIIYMVLCIPGGAGFLPSTVWWIFHKDLNMPPSLWILSIHSF